MTQFEIRNHIYKKYNVNQSVNMRQRNQATGEIIRRFKATIVQFYSRHVSCVVRGYRESFTYWDMMQMTAKGGSEIDKGRIKRNQPHKQ